MRTQINFRLLNIKSYLQDYYYLKEKLEYNLLENQTITQTKQIL